MAGLRFFIDCVNSKYFCKPPPYGHNDVLQSYDLPVTGCGAQCAFSPM